MKLGDIGEGHFYSSPAEALMAFDRKVLGLQAMVKIRVSDKNPPKGAEPEGWEPGQPWLAETTLGRVLFNDLLPEDYPFMNEPMPKKRQAAIVNDLAERYPMVTVARTLAACSPPITEMRALGHIHSSRGEYARPAMP